eukprot:scaffold28022_cov41-Attheya_sp.AAC.1
MARPIRPRSTTTAVAIVDRDEDSNDNDDNDKANDEESTMSRYIRDDGSAQSGRPSAGPGATRTTDDKKCPMFLSGTEAAAVACRRRHDPSCIFNIQYSIFKFNIALRPDNWGGGGGGGGAVNDDKDQ